MQDSRYTVMHRDTLHEKINCVLTLPTLPRYSSGPRESKTPIESRFTTEHLRCSTVEPRFMPVYPGVIQRRVQQCERQECYRVLSPWAQALAKVLASARYSSRKVYRPKFEDGYQNNNGFSWGAMHAMSSDSTFGMAMYVSLCGYMKWNKLKWR